MTFHNTDTGTETTSNMNFCLKNGKFTKCGNNKKRKLFLKINSKNDNVAVKNCGESSFQEGLSWRDGRRIEELEVLAEALGKCCGEDCSSMLDLRNTEKGKMYGFASLLWVRCGECGRLNSIITSKPHQTKKDGSTSVRCEYNYTESYNTFWIMSYWNTEIYFKFIWQLVQDC